ncbi:hypothetical protein [Actinokineospora terrae]|uniref:hypothetical protein n=1 Tax=Actinokineospora terrae TaxID=155974 RepID=UPI003183BD4B
MSAIVGARAAVDHGVRGLNGDGNGTGHDDVRTRHDSRIRFVAGGSSELGLVAGVGVTQEVQQVGEVIVAQSEHTGAAQRLAQARAGGGDGAVVADVGGHPGAPLAQQQSGHADGRAVVQYSLQPAGLAAGCAGRQHDGFPGLAGGPELTDAHQGLGFQHVQSGVQVGCHPHTRGKRCLRYAPAEQGREVVDRHDDRGRPVGGGEGRAQDGDEQRTDRCGGTRAEQAQAVCGGDVHGNLAADPDTDRQDR